MTKIESIKNKILALQNMISERGASETEAMAALAKADKLMTEYGLTEADLEVAQAKRDMSHGEFKYGIKTQHPCAKWCSKTIGQFCGVVTWYDSSVQKSNGFGFNDDVEMYEFLLKLVHDSMNREWKDYLQNNASRPGVSRHTEYWSFSLGMAERINEKIRMLMEAREVKTDSTGTDLVIKKYAAAQAGMKEMLPGLLLRSSRGRGICADGSAMAEGRRAGERVNLNRPVTSSPNSGRILGR